MSDNENKIIQLPQQAGGTICPMMSKGQIVMAQTGIGGFGTPTTIIALVNCQKNCQWYRNEFEGCTIQALMNLREWVDAVRRARPLPDESEKQ